MAFLVHGSSPARRPSSVTEVPYLARELSTTVPEQSHYRQTEMLRRAARARSRPYQVSLTAQLPYSYLELASVGERTIKDYRQRLLELYSWSTSTGLSWTCAAELDAVLVQLFDELFWKGLPADHGSKLIAVLKFFRPGLGSSVESLDLPRSARAIKSWTR